MPWIHTYAPKNSSDIPHQANGKRIVDFLTSFKKQKKKALLLYGPAGSGKTSAIHAVAQELNLELVETNASDVRNKDAIIERIGAATKQRSLFGGDKVILVDEVDGLSGHQDRGGAAALAKIIAGSAFPIIMTANAAWTKKLSTIRKKAVLIEFGELSPGQIVAVLERICEGEGITFDPVALKGLARRSGGDLRAAINDLETLTAVTKKLDRDILNDLGERDREDSMMNALIKVLKSTDPDVALGAFFHVADPLDTCLLWLEENIPSEYKKKYDLERAFDALSKADVFYGRIRRWQHWRFLSYVSTLATAGVAVAKDEKYPGFQKFVKPSRILKMWIMKNKFRKRDSVALKVATELECSKRQAVQQHLPYFAHMVANSPAFATSIAQQFDLSQEEVDWLKASVQ